MSGGVELSPLFAGMPHGVLGGSTLRVSEFRVKGLVPRTEGVGLQVYGAKWCEGVDLHSWSFLSTL